MLFGAAAASRSAQMWSLATSSLFGDRLVWTQTVQITVYFMGGVKFPVNDKNTHIYKAISRITWMHPACLFQNTGLLHKQNKKTVTSFIKFNRCNTFVALQLSDPNAFELS